MALPEPTPTLRPVNDTDRRDVEVVSVATNRATEAPTTEPTEEPTDARRAARRASTAAGDIGGATGGINPLTGLSIEDPSIWRVARWS